MGSAAAPPPPPEEAAHDKQAVAKATPEPLDNAASPSDNRDNPSSVSFTPTARKMASWILKPYHRLKDQIGERLDHRDEPRWDIAGADSFSEGNSLVITDTDGIKHAFDSNKITAFHYEPLVNEPETIDLIIWERREGTSSIRPIYAGTFNYKSNADGKIKALRNGLRVG